MINLNFAPNEEIDDVLVSLFLIFQPWLWRRRISFSDRQKILSLLGFSSDFCFFPFLTGRAAWYHFLKSLNFSPGSEILIQGFTCEAVVLPILANKLKPVYIDIEEKTFSMNYSDLISKTTSGSKVLLLQHTFGFTPLYREKIRNFCQKNNLILIEDVAHGFDRKIFSSTNKKERVNLLLSFGRSKFFSSVFGGGIITNDKKIVKLLEKEEEKMNLPSYSFIFKLLLYKPMAVLIKKTFDFKLGKLIDFGWKKTNFFIPEITPKEKKGEYDFLLDKSYPLVLVNLLIHQLKKAKKICQKRQEISNFYKKIFKNKHPDFCLLRYPLLLKNPEKIIKKLRKEKIFLGSWYNQVVAPKEVSLEKMKYVWGDCPKAEEISKQIINLPTNISLNEAVKIVKFLNEN